MPMTEFQRACLRNQRQELQLLRRIDAKLDHLLCSQDPTLDIAFQFKEFPVPINHTTANLHVGTRYSVVEFDAKDTDKANALSGLALDGPNVATGLTLTFR